METWWTVIFSLVAGALGFYYYLTKDWNYFKKRGLPYVEPTFFFGSIGPVVFRKTSSAENSQRLYNKYPDAKYFGFFDFGKRIVMLRDPELIKLVTVKSFDHFVDRISIVHERMDPIFSNSLLSLRGEKWRDMRALLSPSYTSSKMKMMFKLVSQCGKDLAEYLSSEFSEPHDVEIRDIFTRYTNDVIATTAFGITVNSLRDRENEFYIMGKDATDFGGIRGLKALLFRFSPFLTRLFKVKFFEDKMVKFFTDVIGSTVATRDAKGITRPDMIQLMMRARDTDHKTELTTDLMTAQAFIFFFAGFDTTATAICWTAHLLATHPSAQERLCAEIDEVLAKSENGEPTFEALHAMEYLDAVISETLRLYPAIPLLNRVCTKPFELPPAAPGCKPFTIDVGSTILFSTYAIQRDPKHFDRPNEFDPDRFSEENKTKINPSTYTPFGIGPRLCIANRFALMDIKLALFHLFAKHNFSPCSKTLIPPPLHRATFATIPENGYWLRVQNRKSKV